MALEFTFPDGHPATIEAARLTITCPRHLDDPIVHCCRDADGGGYYETTNGFRSEYVADAEPWQGLSEGRRHSYMTLWGAESPVAVVPDDGPHFRVHLDCTRPSCTYHAILRCDGAKGFWALFDLVLDRMQDAGVRHAVLHNAEDWREWARVLSVVSR